MPKRDELAIEIAALMDQSRQIQQAILEKMSNLNSIHLDIHERFSRIKELEEDRIRQEGEHGN